MRGRRWLAVAERPTTVRHERSSEPIHGGGPVMPRTIVALFRSEGVPPAPSFHVLQGIFLSMHPAIVEQLQPPSEELLFRRDTTGMWEELLDRASAHRTRGAARPEPAFHR